ncbi:MAG: DUF3786 domain-containing protein [Firmicutes bacterium]|nr:DUF3786 domain-containing protein [Bacillota bacterium]
MPTNYVLAYKESCRLLAAEKDPQAVARRAGCRFEPAGSYFELPVLGRLYRVDYPSGAVTAGEALPEAPGTPPAPEGDSLLTTSILAVQYLATARGIPLTGEWVAFRELPGGQIYNAPFTSRTVRPMVARFGQDPAALVDGVLRLGGRKQGFGHASGVVDVFPRIPVCLIVWQGDEEVPPSGQILFDRSAPAYLETEALVVAAGQAFLAVRWAAGNPALESPPSPGTLEPE